LPEQVTHSTADGSEMYVDAHGMLPFEVMDFNRNWNSYRNFTKIIITIIIQIYAYSLSPVVEYKLWPEINKRIKKHNSVAFIPEVP